MSAGPQVRIDVDIYDVADGSNVGSARVEGSPDDILSLVDGLSVGIARELLGSTGEQVAMARRIASITTNSVSALKDYLEGERLQRLGDFDAAAEALERAVAVDSTFALAWTRLASAVGWGGASDYTAEGAREQARIFAERLSPREATLLEARTHYAVGEAEAIALLVDYVRRYPDDAEAWYQLGDSYYHMAVDQQGMFPSSRDQAAAALGRAAELDAGFAPYRIHVVDFAFAAGDSAAARAAIEADRENGGVENVFSEGWDVGFDILFGDEPAMRAGIEAALGLDNPGLALGLIGNQVGVDLVPRELELRRAMAEAGDNQQTRVRLLEALWRAGRWNESVALMADAQSEIDALTTASTRFAWHAYFGIGDAEGVHDELSRSTCSALECFGRAFLKVQHGAFDGHAQELTEGLEELDSGLEAALASLQIQGNPALVQVFTSLFTAFAADAPAWADLLSGNAEAALEAWRTREDGVYDYLGAAWAADDVGDFEFAERNYLATNWRQNAPFATYRLAKMYERMGRVDDALAQYNRLALMWAEADDDFEPAAEVRDARARLGGAR